MSTSIKNNFILNLLNTLTGLLFPLITFPYVSRILFADGIGQIQFFQSIINYIALFSALGIPLYAVREIDRVRDDKLKCSKVAIEILLLHLLLTSIGYIIVGILVVTVTEVKNDVSLFLLLSSHLFFTAIGVAWFYQGVEDFKYITIRSLVVRLLSLIALFLFVKEKSDLFVYATILIAAEVGSNVFNFIRLRKFIDKTIFRTFDLHPFVHLKPALKIFVLNLVISIYVNLDSVMLGFLKNETAVGYYTAATRLTKAILGIVSSLGAVLLPRFSNLISNNNMEEFKKLTTKAIDFVLCLSLPMSIGLIFLASPIIKLFCGETFEPAILTLQIVSPIILFIGLSGILGMQILYPLGKESIVILSTLIGAVINFSLNYWLIPLYAQNGAAFATVIAEFLVTFSMIIIGRKYFTYSFLSKRLFCYSFGGILTAIVLYLCMMFISDSILQILLGVFFSIVVYYVYLLLCKDYIVLQINNTISNLYHRCL